MDQTAYFEQMRQKRRSEILETAHQLIMEQGLAQTLDVSTVTLYKYYKNSIAVIEDLYQTTASSLYQFPDFFPADKASEGILSLRLFCLSRQMCVSLSSILLLCRIRRISGAKKRSYCGVWNFFWNMGINDSTTRFATSG